MLGRRGLLRLRSPIGVWGLVGLLGLVGLSGLCGCGRDAHLTYSIEFPNEAAFLAAEAARATLYDAEQDVEICRKLLAGETPSEMPLAESDQVDVCQFQAGAVPFAALDQGVRALFVEVIGSGSVPILRGCTAFSLDTSGGSDVIVELAVTPDFSSARRMTSCQNAADRCAGRCQ